MTTPAGPVDAVLRSAARDVLARDGRDFLLREWQVAWLIAVTEGREGFVPLACGLGKGWLDARMAEARARLGDTPTVADG
jgi:hypothetical protein